MIVWVCSRWRELAKADKRHVPFTLEAMADDLGWRKGGGAATELGAALDALRQATFRARVFNARLGETRIDTFGLIDRWERGERHQSARPARPGFIVLGDWLTSSSFETISPTSAGPRYATSPAARPAGSWCTSTPSASQGRGGGASSTTPC